MKGRADSLAAAAELMGAIEALCSQPPSEGGLAEVMRCHMM
jgi:hypothetical protein